MASGSEADAEREHLKGGGEERIEQGQERLGVDDVISESGEDAARRGGRSVDEALIDQYQRVTQEQRLPASAGTVAQGPKKGIRSKRLPAAAATVSQGLMKAILSKPSWQDKLGEETIVNKYEREAIEQGLPPEIAKETIKHLQLEARRHHSTSKESSSASTSEPKPPANAISSRQADTEAEMQDLISSVAALQARVPYMMEPALEEKDCGVWLVDNIVPEMLHNIIETRLDAIANLPEKDFHPMSNNQVQDLIHPSLFPYIDGVSPLSVDKSTLPPTLPPTSTRFHYWNRPYTASKYQWLPAQFYVNAKGSVQIRSYINNLERAPNRDLYRAIELLFEIFLPMFEKLLPRRQRRPQRLRMRELQVIVKAANYIVQPKGTVYEGTWHVEGMSHEQIMASGIYYYSTSPWLEDHGLEFRRERDENKDFPEVLKYHRGDYEPDPDDPNPQTPEVAEMWRRLSEEREQNIPLGAVPTLQNRLIAFSNGLQHKVSKVVNNSYIVGTRKILVFFLVDPTTEIVSTKHVPEQQWERIYPKMRSALREVSVHVSGKTLPAEIEHEILTRAGHGRGMSMAEAKKHRLTLMTERAAKARDDNDEWEREYSLCEH